MARFERVVGVGQPQALCRGQVPPGLGARIEICYLTVGAPGADWSVLGRFVRACGEAAWVLLAGVVIY